MGAPGTTPGPWSVVEASEHHGFYITSDFGSTICDLYTMSRPWNASERNGGDSKPVPFFEGMDGPNAHLIAASPALYDALEGLLQPFGSDIEELAARNKARAALALARGERS